MTEGRIRSLNRPSMVDLLAPDAPHDVALLGDAAACRTASSGARYGGTREHMPLTGPMLLVGMRMWVYG